jgi:Amino acid permease
VLTFSDYMFVLAISGCSYLLFNFLSLNAGWLHRVDNAAVVRPWRAPTPIVALGTAFAFVNAAFLGGGAKVWGGPHTLWIAGLVVGLILPIFAYRHYVQDGGRFPPNMLRDLGIADDGLGERRAGVLPFVTLAVGSAIVLLAYVTARLG